MSEVRLQVVGMCAVLKESDTVGHIGLVNPEYFRHLHLHDHFPEFAIAKGAIARIEGDQGVDATADEIKRWRFDENGQFRKWSLFHRRAEIEHATNGALKQDITRAAKLGAALAAAQQANTVTPGWYKDRHVVAGTVLLRSGTVADGKERDKNYFSHDFHKAQWIFQPFVPGQKPVEQNNLNDCMTYTVGEATAVKIFELVGSVPVATIFLKAGVVDGYVANVAPELNPQTKAPGVLEHVLAYYALYGMDRHLSMEKLRTLPIPFGNPTPIDLKNTNGDVYCPGGGP